MLIDAASGVETQTKKLFEVCALRKTPIITFVNKLDREGRDPFELMEEIETVLGIRVFQSLGLLAWVMIPRCIPQNKKSTSHLRYDAERSRPVP